CSEGEALTSVRRGCRRRLSGGRLMLRRGLHAARLAGMLAIVILALSKGHALQAALAVQSDSVFTPTGSMSESRYAHAGTRLLDGRVLFVGGQGPAGRLATAELY